MQGVFESRGLPKEQKKVLIILMPKRLDASTPEHFKMISLCTTLYKVCARILARHLKLIIPYLISSK